MSLEREFEVRDKVLTITQDFTTGELGATVWDSALVIIPYLQNIEEFPVGFFDNKRAIELGCGTGCVGLTLATLGADVLLTDREPLIPLITKNVQLNNLSHKVKVCALEWGEDVSSLNPPFDIVLMSDVVAVTYSEAYPLLLQTLLAITSPSTLILLAYEKRDFKDLKFFQMLLQNNFKYNKIPDSKMDPLWQDDDIGIFKIQKSNSQ